MQRSLQLQMRKPSIETMGTVDCQQGMEGWYDAAVCGLVREVVGVYSVSSIMCVPEIGIRPLETQGGSGLLFFMFVHTPRPGAPAQPPYQLDAPYTRVWELNALCDRGVLPRSADERHHHPVKLFDSSHFCPLVRARPSFARLTLQLGACWSLLEVGWCKVEFRISHYALRAPRMS